MGLGNITFGGNNIRSGAYTDRPANPNPGDWYTALDTGEILACFGKKGYHIETAVFTQSIDTQDSFTTGLTFNNDGTKLYEVGVGSDKIYEYELTKVGEWESIAPTEPVGTIKMFSGYQSNIPPKWQICDGTNGTPDLRNRFVVGAGDTYTNGDTGGESEHTLTVGEMPPHNHSYIYDDYGSSAQDGGNNPYVANESNGTNYVSTEGGGQPHENRPPYYALYYIMKVSE
jgi:microcystin-dependent protein